MGFVALKDKSRVPEVRWYRHDWVNRIESTGDWNL